MMHRHNRWESWTCACSYPEDPASPLLCEGVGCNSGVRHWHRWESEVVILPDIIVKPKPKPIYVLVEVLDGLPGLRKVRKALHESGANEADVPVRPTQSYYETTSSLFVDIKKAAYQQFGVRWVEGV